jgi:hypothetical protein
MSGSSITSPPPPEATEACGCYLIVQPAGAGLTMLIDTMNAGAGSGSRRAPVVTRGVQ